MMTGQLMLRKQVPHLKADGRGLALREMRIHLHWITAAGRAKRLSGGWNPFPPTKGRGRPPGPALRPSYPMT
jgi:hypothetical protein